LHPPAKTPIERIILKAMSRMRARLPSKFKKSMWFRRGDYVIVDGERTSASDGAQPATSGGWVVHSLQREQIKYLRERGLWPEAFATAYATDASRADPAADDDDYLVNHNHAALEEDDSENDSKDMDDDDSNEEECEGEAEGEDEGDDEQTFQDSAGNGDDAR